MERGKLLVVSDSHGSISALKAVLSWAADQEIEAGVFLGDGVQDMSAASAATGFSCGWKSVKGNNDYDFSMPSTGSFEFCGFRFFICHGHYYSVYAGYNKLITQALKERANIALFGHTHVPFYKNANGLLLINPGSVGRPRGSTGATFAVIECATGQETLGSNRPQTVFWEIESKGNIRELDRF
jgi:putative phosphoesterase